MWDQQTIYLIQKVVLQSNCNLKGKVCMAMVSLITAQSEEVRQIQIY